MPDSAEIPAPVRMTIDLNWFIGLSFLPKEVSSRADVRENFTIPLSRNLRVTGEIDRTPNDRKRSYRLLGCFGAL